MIGGGSILGHAVDESRLLTLISDAITGSLGDQPVFVMMLVLLILMSIVATFVSHTVSSMILLPLFAKIGLSMATGGLEHSRQFVLTGVLMNSGAMVLPVSSFPNINSFSLCKEDGKQYLKTWDYIKVCYLKLDFFLIEF